MLRRTNTNLTIGSTFTAFVTTKTAQGIADKTIHNYRQSLTILLNDTGLTEQDSPEIIDTDQWILTMQEAGKKASTINHYIRDIRAYMYWLYSSYSLIPYKKIRTVKAQEEVPKGYSTPEIKRLLQVPAQNTYYKYWRAWAVVNFVMGTGARVGSIITLQKEDIDWDSNTITFRHTKSKKHLQVPLTPALRAALTKFNSIWANDTPYVFPSDSGGQATAHGLLQAHKAYCSLCGVRAGSLHELRHTFARLCATSGMPVTTIQHLLGHSSIEMTVHYISLMVDDLPTSLPIDQLTQGKVRRTV